MIKYADQGKKYVVYKANISPKYGPEYSVVRQIASRLDGYQGLYVSWYIKKSEYYIKISWEKNILTMIDDSINDILSNITENKKKKDKIKDKEDIQKFIDEVIQKFKEKIDGGNDLTKYAGEGYNTVYYKLSIPDNLQKYSYQIVGKVVDELNGYQEYIRYKEREYSGSYDFTGRSIVKFKIIISWKKSIFKKFINYF